MRLMRLMRYGSPTSLAEPALNPPVHPSRHLVAAAVACFETDVRESVNSRLGRLAVTSVCRLHSRAAVPLQLVDMLTAAVAFEFR